MTEYSQANEIKELIDAAQEIVIIQADNPDSDSLASSLAIEQVLASLGKKTYLYCGVDIPSYLRYLEGSDRVSTELPHKFDLSIIIDTSSDSLLGQLEKTGQKHWVTAKPCIVIDHHATEPTINFAKVICNQPAVATGEVIYELARQLQWDLNHEAMKFIAMAIMGDSLGLTTEATSARSIHIVAELVEGGVSLAELEAARRATMRRESELVHYKGRLLERVEFFYDEKIATVTIPWDEIEKYSPLYNPPMLVLDDMRLAKNTDVAIAFKIYPDGKVTVKIRCNYGGGIADKLAEHFGGGGHPYAAGFKVTDGTSYDDVKNQTVKYAAELLEMLESKKHETI